MNLLFNCRRRMPFEEIDPDVNPLVLELLHIRHLTEL
jgi:hypothetical protein